jgi:hypothetical protein
MATQSNKMNDQQDQKKVGRDRKGRFTENSQAAKMAGSKGGKAAQMNGKAYRLTNEDRSRGGKNSHGGGRTKQQ